MLYELNGNTLVYTNLQRKCRFVPLGKKLQPTPVGGLLQEVMVTVGAVTFYLRGQTCTFSADSVRAYVFQQLLCITYALTPYGSKVMIHGVCDPQYQGYGKKSS
jgi:hypothetical protein